MKTSEGKWELGWFALSLLIWGHLLYLTQVRLFEIFILIRCIPQIKKKINRSYTNAPLPSKAMLNKVVLSLLLLACSAWMCNFSAHLTSAEAELGSHDLHSWLAAQDNESSSSGANWGPTLTQMEARLTFFYYFLMGTIWDSMGGGQ